MTSPLTDDRNAREIAYWNGPGGERWVSHQRMQDALLAEVAGLLLERAAPRAGETLRDADSLLVDHAGAESNTCVGLARLGFHVAWISRVGADAAGRDLPSKGTSRSDSRSCS